MKALLKIEWIKTWRTWPVFIMGIGIPVGFFLLFSSIFSAPTPEAQKEFFAILYVNHDWLFYV